MPPPQPPPKCVVCGKPDPTLKCDRCAVLKLPDALFCDQTCWDAGAKEHKKVHTAAMMARTKPTEERKRRGTEASTLPEAPASKVVRMEDSSSSTTGKAGGALQTNAYDELFGAVGDENSHRGLLDSSDRTFLEFDMGGTPITSCTLHAAVESERGRRETSEDTYVVAPNLVDGFSLYVVCDGHGGKRVADLVAAMLPEALKEVPVERLRTSTSRVLVEVFAKVDRGIYTKLKGRDRGGAACTAVLIKDGDVWIANLGDCRAVGVAAGKAVQLTRDHRPSDPSESARVLAAGGKIVCGVRHKDKVAHGERVVADGTKMAVQVTRAFGDFALKGKEKVLDEAVVLPLTHIPEISHTQLTDTTDFILIACDGLWDVLDNDAVAKAAIGQLHRGPRHMAQSLVKLALESDSMDNVTVLAIVPSSLPTAPTPDIPTKPLTLSFYSASEKGRGKIMYDYASRLVTTHTAVEDDVVTIPDLHKYLSGIRDDASASNPLRPGAVKGSFRKAITTFLRLLEFIEKHFYATGKAPPMAFTALLDGRCGRRAVELSKLWLPVFVFTEVFSLLIDPEGELTPVGEAASPSNCFANAKHGDIKARIAAAFESMEQAFLERAKDEEWNDGCSCVAVVTIGSNLYCANTGDTHAVLARRSGDKFSAVSVSGKGHKGKVESEKERVKKAGGIITPDGLLYGILPCTRSIGDRPMKNPAAKIPFRPPSWSLTDEKAAMQVQEAGNGAKVMQPTPDVVAFAPKDDDLFLLLGNAAVWEVMSDRAAASFIESQLTEADAATACVEICREAVRRKSTNAAVTLITLK